MVDNKKNSFWLAFQYITVILTSFITLKLNISHFGLDLFGVFILISSFWGFGTLIDLGFGTAMIKFIAQSKHENDSEFNSLVSTGFIIFLIAGIIIFIGGNLLSDLVFFHNVKIIPAKFAVIAHPVFLLMGIFFFTQYLGVFFRSIVEGLNVFWISSRIVILYNILTLISVILTVVTHSNLIVLAGCYVLSSASTMIITIIYIKVKYQVTLFKISLFSFRLFKRVLRFSISVQFASLSGAAIDPVVKFLIGNYASINYVPYYEIARRFSTALSGLFTTTFRYYLPKTSILKRKEEYVQFLFESGAGLSRLSITYSGLAFGLLQGAVAIVIKLWFGYDEVIFIFLLLSVSEVINNFGYVLYVFLIGIGKADFLMILQLFYLIILSAGVAAGLILFKSIMGLLGSFVAVAIINILLLWYVQRLSGISIKNYLSYVKINKLILLISLIMITILSQYLKLIPAFPAVFSLSILSGIFFFSDIKLLFKNKLKFGF